MSIRVLLVDDNAVVLRGLQYFLGTHPDIVVMDLIMPAMNGIEATRQIKLLYPDVNAEQYIESR